MLNQILQINYFLFHFNRTNLSVSFPLLYIRCATRGVEFGAFVPPKIFKTLHSNFDICRNFQRKMKFYILIIFKKSYLIFSLSCSLISLQESGNLIENHESGNLIENFVNDRYSTTNMLEVSTWEIVWNRVGNYYCSGANLSSGAKRPHLVEGRTFLWE